MEEDTFGEFFMKIRIILALILGVSSAFGAASEPYLQDEDDQSASMRTVEGDDGGYAATDESAFPAAVLGREKHLRHHHRAVGSLPLVNVGDEGAPEVVTSNPDTHRSTDPSNGSSMKQFPPIDPGSYFDRGAYLIEHVQGLVEAEKRFGTATRVCRWCNITWNGLGGASTAASLIISAIGASGYMDPRLANILTVILGVVSGGCIWAGTQAKKASHEYHEEQVNIQSSLGVPTRWRDPEVRIDIDQFNGRGGQPAAAGAR